jgi:hypothetical protein
MFPGFRLGISSLDWAVAPNRCGGPFITLGISVLGDYFPLEERVSTSPSLPTIYQPPLDLTGNEREAIRRLVEIGLKVKK